MNHQIVSQFIQECIEKMGFSCESIKDIVSEDGSTIFSVQSKDSKYLIGRDGETLQSFQHLVRSFIEKNTEHKEKVLILLDINNYQKEKIEKIKTIAHMMAERSRFFQSSVELDPMNSFERHVVHEYLADKSDVETKSEGFGMQRRVVIHYKK